MHHKIDLMKPIQISLDRLSTEPGPFSMSYGFELAPLINSLQNVGLVNSPIVMEGEGGAILIITGYRRIAAFRAMGKESIGCRMCIQDTFAPSDALLINFFENLATREFNPVEKGMILNRLARFLSPQEILTQYMPLLGLASNKSILTLYISFDNDFDESMKQGLAKGRLSEQTAKALLDMNPGDRKAMGIFFLALRFNMNQQKQVIEILTDISHITGATIADLLGEKEVGRIISAPSLNHPQKTKALLGLWRHQRYPRLTLAEKTFKQQVSRLCLPKNVQIQASPYFEADLYRMEIFFKTGKDLKDKIEHLLKIEELEHLEDPWEGAE